LKPKLVLMLARDMGAGNVLGPTSVELRKQGHDVYMLAEEGGQAMNRLKVPFDVVDEAALRRKLKTKRPGVIVTGLSSPRCLETHLDEYAACVGIPLVHIEDYWGCHKRTDFSADLVVTVDETAACLAQIANPGHKVVVAGFAGISPVTPNAALFSRMAEVRTRGGYTLVYPDGGPECELALPMLVQSILRSRTRIVLIPKVHLSFKNVAHPSGNGSWDDWCREQIRPLREKDATLDVSDPTDAVCEVADGVVSCYSSTMFRPAVKGKLALTLWDDFIKAQLLESTGLHQTPLMLAGEYPVLDAPRSLDGLFRSWPKYDLKPFDAKTAADAILQLLE